MKNSTSLIQEVVTRLHLNDTPEEIRSIAELLFEHLFGLSRTDIMAGKSVAVGEDTVAELQKMVDRLNKGEPVQYVLGQAEFYGRKFHVNPSVLIPRLETEELVRAVVEYERELRLGSRNEPLRVLDIGTGSGCIPVTLFHEAAPAEIYATDKSTAALAVAVGNADTYGAKITFIENDILKGKLPVSGLDVIVSNPPYVTEKEKREMKSNVVEFEPHEALFVSDVDPLIFYKAIARQSKEVLKSEGMLAVEINEKFGKEVAALLVENGFARVAIVKDVAGKDRLVTGTKVGT